MGLNRLIMRACLNRDGWLAGHPTLEIFEGGKDRVVVREALGSLDELILLLLLFVLPDRCASICERPHVWTNRIPRKQVRSKICTSLLEAVLSKPQIAPDGPGRSRNAQDS